MEEALCLIVKNPKPRFHFAANQEKFRVVLSVSQPSLQFIHGDAPLAAVQLLLVNMVMETLGALALATEPPK